MPRKKSLPTKGAPLTVREGNALVIIYSSINRGKPIYTLAYKALDGRRMRVSFRNYDQAKLEAENIVVAIHNGTLDKLELTGEQRRAHERAAVMAAEMNRPLDSALMEFKEARDLLPDEVSLVEAARFFTRFGAVNVKRRDVVDVVDDFVKQLVADNRSERHVEDARARLRKLASSFDGPVDGISQHDLQEWLNGLEVAGRTRNNYRGMVISLFHYARGHSYLPQGLPTAADGLSKAKEDSNEIGILTPAQMSVLLKNASERLIPLLVIGGFAGLRSAEIFRLDWEEVDFEQSHIEIKSGKAKTAQRRLAPLLPNLMAWLKPYRGRTGPICETDEIETERRELVKKLEMEWPHNALRHSFASYRLATTSEASKVALEMGNSPQMIFRNYRKVVTEAQATDWFEIRPV